MDNNVLLDEIKEYLDLHTHELTAIVNEFKQSRQSFFRTYEDALEDYEIPFDYLFYFKYRSRLEYWKTFNSEKMDSGSEELLIEATMKLNTDIRDYLSREGLVKWNKVHPMDEWEEVTATLLEYVENDLKRIKKKSEVSSDLSDDDYLKNEYVIKRYLVRSLFCFYCWDESVDDILSYALGD